MKLPLSFLLLSLSLSAAQAADISVVGLFPGKAVLVIDGKAPKTYSVGAKVAPEVKLVDVDQTTATFETGGKRQRFDLGAHVNRMSAATNSSVTLKADVQGHFVVQGQINGGSMRMLVDTGASMVAMPASDARRLGIDYRKGKPVYINTANGVTTAYQVMLDSVKVGDITLNQVDGVVQESGLPFVLLGMSFLKRMEMRRDGDEMVLTKRY
ncbi:TIGR02281 family clan AA aspartic protease [uncultured Oxalicibacterium sp.]|uniref:retropepsin-like aspartic protease family protein n=1 Tax=uncultured Oxalicibacterium sp. TaxID=1168540 RepID=UPI0025E79133|nr:TIGR02281 family clan AA aspartic protease [uncultured Oxalicibacterium sp.]